MTTEEQVLNLRNNSEYAQKFFSEKLAFTLGPVELKKIADAENVKIIDVRMHSDYQIGHIPNAISIPYEELNEKMQELSKNDLHIVYCYNTYCHLAARAAYMLAKNSFSVVELCGGFDTWVEKFHFAVVQQN